MGHLEGITFIDTRGDGRYFISNGKDQTIKLWDIRKMSSNVTRYALLAFWYPYLLSYMNMTCLDKMFINNSARALLLTGKIKFMWNLTRKKAVKCQVKYAMFMEI